MAVVVAITEVIGMMETMDPAAGRVVFLALMQRTERLLLLPTEEHVEQEETEPVAALDQEVRVALAVEGLLILSALRVLMVAEVMVVPERVRTVETEEYQMEIQVPHMVVAEQEVEILTEEMVVQEASSSPM